jgi:hypothetical protein
MEESARDCAPAKFDSATVSHAAFAPAVEPSPVTHCQPHGIGRRLSAHPRARVPKANQIQIRQNNQDDRADDSCGSEESHRDFIHWRIKTLPGFTASWAFSPCETFYFLPKICSLQPPKGGSASISPISKGRSAGQTPAR